MYDTIMVPVDLAHKDKLDKALSTAGAFAKQFGSSLSFIGVTATAPSAVAHNPEEYADKLAEFAREQSGKMGVSVEARAYTAADPQRDLDDVLDKAAHDVGADLVIMASHMPGIYEHVFNSNAGYLASHSDISVFVVR